MKHSMWYENPEIEVSRREGALMAHFRDMTSGVVWQSPPCETAQQLWWHVDRYFLWELELFPARQCPERDQLRAEFLELAGQIEEAL